MAVLYQVWVPAVAFAHVVGLAWLAWAVSRQVSRQAVIKLLRRCLFRFSSPQTCPDNSRSVDLEYQVVLRACCAVAAGGTGILVSVQWLAAAGVLRSLANPCLLKGTLHCCS